MGDKLCPLQIPAYKRMEVNRLIGFFILTLPVSTYSATQKNKRPSALHSPLTAQRQTPGRVGPCVVTGRARAGAWVWQRGDSENTSQLQGDGRLALHHTLK